jgi:hypothetical protein
MEWKKKRNTPERATSGKDIERQQTLLRYGMYTTVKGRQPSYRFSVFFGVIYTQQEKQAGRQASFICAAAAPFLPSPGPFEKGKRNKPTLQITHPPPRMTAPQGGNCQSKADPVDTRG